MKTVVGIGETILDVIFRNNEPRKAVPGGSVFNAMVSLARCGAKTDFVSQTGNDHVGRLIESFMEKNGLSAKHVSHYKSGNTALSMAFLNEKNDADYQFYKQYQEDCDMEWPKLTKECILLFGSYYAINPTLRPLIECLLKQNEDSITYYDPNFRKSHIEERNMLMSNIMDNIEHSDIVRGSDEDFRLLFDTINLKQVYEEKIKSHCGNLIVTCAEKGVELFTPNFEKHYDTEKIEPTSTIGAGDNFNAGIIFGLLKLRLEKKDINHITPTDWESLIDYGIRFSTKVCLSFDNYVPKDFDSLLQV